MSDVPIQSLTNISRATYEMQIAPAQYTRGQLSRERISAMPHADDGSRTSIDAFLRVFDQADSLDCIADITVSRDPVGVDTAPFDAADIESPRYVKTVLLTHVDTMKKAKLVVTYTADNQYSAEVILGASRQLSLKNGAKKAAALIEDYLSGRKKTRQLPIVRREAVLAVDSEHKFADIEAEFDPE